MIDYDAFAANVAEVRQLREQRRVSEDEFIRMAREPGTVVLDARSERLYRLRHVEGAVNLTFPEFTAETLARLIPTRDTRLRWMQSVIHCTHYVAGAGEQAYLHREDAPEITFVNRDPIDRSDEAYH